MTEDNKVEPTTQGERDKISARLQDVTAAPEKETKEQDEKPVIFEPDSAWNPPGDPYPKGEAVQVMAVTAQRYMAYRENRHGTPVDFFQLSNAEQDIWYDLARKQIAEMEKYGRYIEARHIPEPS